MSDIKYGWVGRKASLLFLFALLGAVLNHEGYSIFWSVIPAFLFGVVRKIEVRP